MEFLFLRKKSALFRSKLVSSVFPPQKKNSYEGLCCETSNNVVASKNVGFILDRKMRKIDYF